MRITQWGEYGILCSLFIALREEEGETTVGAAEIAESQDIALQYAQQILQRLRRGDVISSVRGPSGGYKLTRPASEISVGQILTAAEGDTFEIICDTKPINPQRCAETSPCTLRELWRDLRAHIDRFLTERTLADLLAAEKASEAPVQLHGTHAS